MIAGLFGAFLLYMIMSAGMFITVHMMMHHIFEVRNEVATPVALIAGFLFPVTIALLVVCLPIALVVWYVRNML